jgi:hypothetical protein
MTRRESVRVILFARGTLIGGGRAVRCAIVNHSASGAMISFSGEPPAPPLRLHFELVEEKLEFPVEVRRVEREGALAVEFRAPDSDRLHHLIAVEQRRALAQGRVNISERRLPTAFQGGRTRYPPRS